MYSRCPYSPGEFGIVTFDRQNYMTPEFVADSNEHKKVTAIWEFFRSLNTDPPLSGPPLDSLMKTIQDDVKKIQDRGGNVRSWPYTFQRAFLDG